VQVFEIQSFLFFCQDLRWNQLSFCFVLLQSDLHLRMTSCMTFKPAHDLAEVRLAMIAQKFLQDQSQQLDFLKKILPNYHHLVKMKT